MKWRNKVAGSSWMCLPGTPRRGLPHKLVAARLISGIDVDTSPNKQPLMNQKAAKDPVMAEPINNSRRLSWIPKTSELKRLPLSDTRITPVFVASSRTGLIRTEIVGQLSLSVAERKPFVRPQSLFLGRNERETVASLQEMIDAKVMKETRGRHRDNSSRNRLVREGLRLEK